MLGIPGTATADYADGWYIGFYALNIFIAIYAILGVLGVFSRFGFIPISFRWIRTALACSAAFFALAMTISLVAVFN